LYVWFSLSQRNKVELWYPGSKMSATRSIDKRYVCIPYELYPGYYRLSLSQCLDVLDFAHSQTYIVAG
jgi:hypothetical protein